MGMATGPLGAGTPAPWPQGRGKGLAAPLCPALPPLLQITDSPPGLVES